MRRILLAALILIFAVDAADARRKRHRSYIVVIPPHAAELAAPRLYGDPRAMVPQPRSARRAPLTLADAVPRDWQLQPPDPNWNGKRFLAPDGASWFAAYNTPATDRPISEHMKTIAFGADETITYLRGERTWVAVSGFKGSRIFYRKAIVACAGRAWHHVAFEYPAELKRDLDRFVALAAQALDHSQTECEETISANRPSR